MIDRYNLEHNRYGSDMYQDDEGEYVKYEDHKIALDYIEVLVRWLDLLGGDD